MSDVLYNTDLEMGDLVKVRDELMIFIAMLSNEAQRSNWKSHVFMDRHGQECYISAWERCQVISRVRSARG